MSVRRVVIENGDAFMRMCTKKILVENGFDVVETANGIEASWDSQPDLGLMVITKPGQATRDEIKKTDPSAETIGIR